MIIPSAKQVEQARELLGRYFRPTRLVLAESLARHSGARVYLKIESDLPTGSFKPRGALNALLTTMAKRPVPGIVAASTGNHGAAVAYAARIANIGATIFLPENPNPVKRARIVALGAKVIEQGDMGAFGPQRVITADDTHTAAAPYQIVNNDYSLLDASDLVFVDAPGTGFSRIAGKNKEKEFYGVDQDAHAFAEFIVAYLAKYGRWNSPKYIFGESYGTPRSAVLVNLLQQEYHVDVNGVIMQAPIEDRNAIPLARDLFRYLVQGLPLESATARARATLLQRSTSKNQIDWAMPVVWSNAKGSLKLEWKRNSQTSAEFQINGRLMLRLLQPGTATLVEGDLANATSIAKTWTQHRRIWIKIDASSSIQTGISQFQVASTEITLKWLSSLCELQKSCSDFVIPINLSESDPATALKKWADDTYARLLPGDLPHEIAAILSCVGENQTFWWQRLCELKGICLAILSPPTNLKVPEWFWRPLLDAGNNPRIIMLSASLPTGEVDAGWLFDTLENIGDTDTMTEYLSSNAARVVAILDFPVQAFYLSKYQIECDALKSLRGVLIDTDAGPIMTASARRFVFEHMKAEEKLETHLRCIEILSDPELPAKSEWFEERLKHLLAARGESNKSVDASPLASYDQLGMSALKEAAVLCHGYLHHRCDSRSLCRGLANSAFFQFHWKHGKVFLPLTAPSKGGARTRCRI